MAFFRRVALAQKVVNCVTEMLSETVLGRAAELDEHLAIHGKPTGPLHGVPDDTETICKPSYNFSMVSG
jgi:Asp-tRNA(Asn)/Glu-tRNA(Gln) amidotransferase A subunit family amidase